MRMGAWCPFTYSITLVKIPAKYTVLYRTLDYAAWEKRLKALPLLIRTREKHYLIFITLGGLDPLGPPRKAWCPFKHFEILSLWECYLTSLVKIHYVVFSKKMKI